MKTKTTKPKKAPKVQYVIKDYSGELIEFTSKKEMLEYLSGEETLELTEIFKVTKQFKATKSAVTLEEVK